MYIKFLSSIVKFILIVAIKITNKSRYKFLLHYLNANGKDIIVNEKSKYNYIDVYNSIDLVSLCQLYHKNIYNVSIDNYYCKKEFYKNPEIFYCLGGFTFSVNTNDNYVELYVVDRYDFNSQQKVNHTPLNLKLPSMVMVILNKIVGYEWLLNYNNGCYINNTVFDYLNGKPFNVSITWKLSKYDWEHFKG